MIAIIVICTVLALQILALIYVGQAVDRAGLRSKVEESSSRILAMDERDDRRALAAAVDRYARDLLAAQRQIAEQCRLANDLIAEANRAALELAEDEMDTLPSLLPAAPGGAS